MEETKTKNYQYKFVDLAVLAGKTVEDCQFEWNALGVQGWKFCSVVNNYAVFIQPSHLVLG